MDKSTGQAIRFLLSLGPVVLLALLLATPSLAADDYISGKRFITISENATAPSPNFRESPSIDLMNWVITEKPAPRPTTRYDRQNQFGSWLVREPMKNCFDTRAFVLIRDSKTPTTPWNVDPCYISGGAWHDPYTNQHFQDAQSLQIDHVVALKNAYISGGFAWNNKTRCAYANFLGNKYHLLAVESVTNTRKGDSTPAQWIPPNPAFRCAYLSAWLRIKTTWRLMMSEAEAQAIYQQVREFKCRPDDFKMSAKDLQTQRQLIDRAINECPDTPPRPRIPPRNIPSPEMFN